jgi:hypothetical protein
MGVVIAAAAGGDILDPDGDDVTAAKLSNDPAERSEAGTF